MKRRSIIFSFILFLCLGNAPLWAQEEGPVRVSGFAGFFHAGYSSQDISSLNQSLLGAGYGELSGSNWELGGGGFLMMNNFLFGGEGFSQLAQEKTQGQYFNRWESGGGLFKAGYVVVSTKGLLFHPALGVGAYSQRLRLMSADQPSTFDPVLADAGNGSELSRKGLLLSGELGITYMPGFDEAGGAGMIFSLSGGYRYQAGDGSWKLWDTTLSDGPKPDFSGLFVRLSIGGGGWNRQHKL